MVNYPYKPPGTQLDDFREDLIKMQQDVEADFRGVGTTIAAIKSDISGAAFAEVIDAARLEWEEPVATFDDLGTTYPQATVGTASMTQDSGKVYRFNGQEWAFIQQIDAGPVNELDARLTADLEIERQRISNLTANAGNTDGNAELLDIRVAFDGVIYATAGDATRALSNYMVEDDEIWGVL